MPNRNNFRHGHSGSGRTKRRQASSEYGTWHDMRNRCNNPNAQSYKNYGGRGITVDPRWNDFIAFFNDVGPRPHPDFVLDRIDNYKGYFPGNVRWIDKSTSNKNRRSFLALHHYSTAELKAEIKRRRNQG